jgi:hypothetical protein
VRQSWRTTPRAGASDWGWPARPAVGEMQVARIFTSETCLAVIAVLSPTPT